MRSVVASALAVALLAPMAASPQAPSTPQGRAGRGPSTGSAQAREATVPFNVGETLTYDVSWSSFLVAGTATVRVAEKKPSTNSAAYYIVVEGRPVPLVARLYNLYYKMDTLLDSVTLMSQRGSLYTEEGAARTLGTTRFDRTARRAFYERQQEKTEKVDYAVPAGTQDGLAVLYALRGRALKTGESLSIPVADGGSLYTIHVQVGALEQVQVPVGQFSAWNLNVGITDAQSQPVWKNNAVWISNDARRLPVKLQAELPVGHFALTLRDLSPR